MEIVTTMVKFRCPKEYMNEQSSCARIFLFPSREGNVKVFVPKSKIIIKEDAMSDSHNVCVMPKWIFFRTKGLAENVEFIEETQHMEVVKDM